MRCVDHRLPGLAALLAIVALVALAIAPPVTGAQATRVAQRDGRAIAMRPVVAGIVIDDETDAPIAGVEIFALGADPFASQTDARGAFLIESRGDSAVVLVFRRLGYLQHTSRVRLRAGDTTRVSFVMSRITRLLDTVAVVARGGDVVPARLEGFERRRHLGRGTFLTRADFERQRPYVLGDVLARVLSVDVVDSAGHAVAVSRRGQKMNERGSSRPCVMRFGIDGLIFPVGTSVNMVQPGDIEAIEVYAGLATLPVELAGTSVNMECGLVLVWTRSGRTTLR
jgi:carboxypeptidase family protein